jgi:hypothetical protein
MKNLIAAALVLAGILVLTAPAARAAAVRFGF